MFNKILNNKSDLVSSLQQSSDVRQVDPAIHGQPPQNVLNNEQM